MSGIQFNSITGPGSAAANSIASALVPKNRNAQAALAPGLHASDAAAGSTPSTAAGTSQTITSANFMTLLVSELKNQDPTQPTDPNTYITQLAQVNSLQQLISINSGISTLDNTIKPAATTTKTGV